jgi:hypothetical protein
VRVLVEALVLDDVEDARERGRLSTKNASAAPAGVTKNMPPLPVACTPYRFAGSTFEIVGLALEHQDEGDLGRLLREPRRSARAYSS